MGSRGESDGDVVIRKRVPAEPAQVYASYPRQGGGRTHLMPVTLWGGEVIAPDGYKGASAWIVPMMVHTGPFGEPLSVGVVEGRAVNVETPR
jgi:hypothetical protein